MDLPIFIATLMRPEGETGVQAHCKAFMAYLRETNLPFELITPFCAPPWKVYPTFAVRKLLNGETNVWWYRYWHSFYLRQTLKKKLQSGNECIVYAQCPLSAEAAISVRASKKQRVFLVTHFNLSQADEWAGKGLIAKDGKLYRSIQRFETNVLPRADGLVFVSEYMKRMLTERIPAISTVKSAVIPNFLPNPRPAEEHPPVSDLINIGTLEARKNQQYLLEIIAALRGLGNPLSLTIIGDGPDKQMLEAKAKALKITDLVHFAGFISNAAEQSTKHKACVHVATIENFPVTLIEAMARGLPLFAVPVGGIPELLGDGSYGLALPLNDPHDAARIIADAFNNQEWMSSAKLAAKARFHLEYTSDKVAAQLVRFLAE